MSTYSDNVDAVKLLALSLPDGCSDGSLTCPACGESGSFNVTREDGELKFICFRVSCKFKGSTGDRCTTTEHSVAPRTVRLFNGQLDALNDYEVDWLSSQFTIDKQYLSHVRFSTQDYRVYYPQHNADGRIGGYIARYYPELNWDIPLNGKPKAYWKPVLQRDCGLMFPTMKVMAQAVKTKSIVLVEDYPSTLRINSQLGLATACMGGTNLYNSMIVSLLSLGIEHVRIVLDNDACDKAIKMTQEIGFCITDTETIPLLNKDVKDMSLQECANTFHEYKEHLECNTLMT